MRKMVYGWGGVVEGELVAETSDDMFDRKKGGSGPFPNG